MVQWWCSGAFTPLTLLPRSAHCALNLLSLLFPRTRQTLISLKLLESCGGVVVVEWWSGGGVVVQ